MNSVICTLFEGHYHYGVASLSNSLYNNGFRGTIYVGFRGALPNWVLKGKKQSVEKWEEAIVLTPAEGLKLVFLPLKTTFSLTNYKPDFILDLWEGPAKDADAFFYFDPDIVVDDTWTCFEEWVNCGVALCEDVNSPLQKYHPRRVGWRNYFTDFDLKFKNDTYVNGGFIGLLKKDISFLKLWLQLQEKMAAAIDGLENSIFSSDLSKTTFLGPKGFSIFDKSDQDALNVTIEAYEGIVSYIGKEGMGFKIGHTTMHHALGVNKPWQRKYFLQALHGRPPRYLDMVYWTKKNYPLKAHSDWQVRRKKAVLKISKVIARFYKV